KSQTRVEMNSRPVEKEIDSFGQFCSCEEQQKREEEERRAREERRMKKEAKQKAREARRRREEAARTAREEEARKFRWCRYCHQGFTHETNTSDACLYVRNSLREDIISLFFPLYILLFL